MAIFEDMKLGWNGADYVIPADRVLGAVAVIEEHMTFPEMMELVRHGKPSLVGLSRTWGAVLRYAGAEVTDDEVYVGMFTGPTVSQRVIEAVNTLLLIMMPPTAIAAANAERAASGNLPAASKPSKPSTRRRSASAAG